MTETVKAPLVSVIMPAYNAEKYIEASIKSVQEQTFSDWELIVVDDGSTDATETKVKSLQTADGRIRYLYQENKKQAAARNNGIMSAKGQWIAFLDADDLWMPEKLSKQIAVAHGNDVDVIFSNGYYLFEDSQQTEPYNSLTGRYKGEELYKILFQHNHVAVLSVMLKRGLTATIGLQDESLKAYGCEDWDYWLRCCKGGARCFGMDDRLFIYRGHTVGTSSNKLSMHMAGCYVLFKNYDASLFLKDEKMMAEKRLVDEVKFIINALYDKGKVQEMFYYLKLLCNLPDNGFKYTMAYCLAKIFRSRSKQLVNYVLSH